MMNLRSKQNPTYPDQQDNAMTEISSDRQFVIALSRGMQILRAFTADEPILGNQEIVLKTGLPRSTVSRLAYTLTLLGYLSYVDGLQKYRLGSGVLSLGYPLLASMTIRQLVRPTMEQLARDTGCTINLGMLDRTNVVFIETCRIDRGNSHWPDIGGTRPLLTSSVGRALLLACEPPVRQAVLNKIKLEEQDDYEHVLRLWEKDSKAYLTRDFCYSQGDWRQEIHGVAAPIRRPLGEEKLALNCTLTIHDSNTSKDILLKKVAPLMLAAIRDIEFASGMVGTR